jgi:peptidoglycan hydrolase CwlO-like protein
VGDCLEGQIAVIGALCTLLGTVIGFLGFSRNRDKDVRNDASKNAVIETQLNNISSGIDNIRIDIKTNERRVTELSERVIRVEESSKQAHKRIDKIENQGGNSNEN